MEDRLDMWIHVGIRIIRDMEEPTLDTDPTVPTIDTVQGHLTIDTVQGHLTIDTHQGHLTIDTVQWDLGPTVQGHLLGTIGQIHAGDQARMN